jgi:hypothetical protein
VKRRIFIAGLGTTAAWPVVARAQQQPERMRRIGVLMGGGENDPRQKRLLTAFTQALADLGWIDGRNVRMDLRWIGGDINRSRALAQELVGLQPDIILTSGLPATVAVRRETPTIPIVFSNVGDPVAGGIVAHEEIVEQAENRDDLVRWLDINHRACREAQESIEDPVSLMRVGRAPPKGVETIAPCQRLFMPRHLLACRAPPMDGRVLERLTGQGVFLTSPVCRGCCRTRTLNRLVRVPCRMTAAREKPRR